MLELLWVGQMEKRTLPSLKIQEADPNKSVVGVFLGVITGMIYELGPRASH